jgi:hypothetical protein
MDIPYLTCFGASTCQWFQSVPPHSHLLLSGSCPASYLGTWVLMLLECSLAHVLSWKHEKAKISWVDKSRAYQWHRLLNVKCVTLGPNLPWKCKKGRIFEIFHIECQIFGGVMPKFVGCHSAQSVFWVTGHSPCQIQWNCTVSFSYEMGSSYSIIRPCLALRWKLRNSDTGHGKLAMDFFLKYIDSWDHTGESKILS